MKLSSPELPTSSTKPSRGHAPAEERFDLAAAKLPRDRAGASSGGTAWFRGLSAKILLPTIAAVAVTAGALVLVIQKESAHIRMERFAELKANARQLQNGVDRILFERYGDAQAFGLNTAFQRDLSNLSAAERTQLARTIDRYVAAYGCYPLSLVLDVSGRIVATNTVSPDGRALPKSIERLIGQDLSSSESVQLARSGRFTTAATPGALTGTVVGRPEQSALIADIYGASAPAWTMAFTAPIKTADGTVVGYWQNHFSAAMVEDLFANAYDSLKKQDLDTAEFTVIDSTGQLILDVDPSLHGNVGNRREDLFKTNLTTGKVAIAVAATTPGATPEGDAFSRHPRKSQAAGHDVVQAAAYARSIPTMGYVGSGFSTLIRVERAQFEDSITALLSATLWTGFLCVAGGGLLVWFVSRPIIRGVNQVRIAIGELASGNVTRTLSTSGQDEVAQMARGYNHARDALASVFGSDQLDWQAIAELRGQTEAISRSQAVIEFNLDGTILTANENFLKTLGYVLDEIQGKHHRLFVDPAEHNSAAYSQFWRDLSAGKFQAAEYKRIGKGGRVIYIQASYNPIFDRDGKPYKVIKFATDVTERKALEINNRRQLEEISRTQAVIEFTPDGTILSANQNFLSTLGYSLDEIKGQHHRMFVDAEFRQSQAYAQFWRDLNDGRFQTAEYKRIGKGGKEVWIQATYNPVFDIDGKVCRVTKFASDISARKRAEANLKQTLTAVASNSQTLAAASEELSATAQTMSSNSEETSAQSNVAAAAAEQVSQNVNTVATAAEEMSASVREIAKNAAEAARVGTAAVKVANDTNTSITKLGDSSNEIGEVIKVITSIAQQTNLLALNATIEAARAGEAGKGFAVVANEVKELAKQTASATEDISAKIEAIQSDTRVAVGAIGEISKIIAQINGIQNTIASAVEEQSATTNEIARNASEAAKGATDITKNISSVSQAARSTSEGAANTLTASGELARLAAALKQIVDAAGVR